jgi:hypothetical protein
MENKILTSKELKKLATACRNSGITYFKGYGIEFQLGESPVKKQYGAVIKEEKALKTGEMTSPVAEDYEGDELSEEARMFWSTPDFPGTDKADAKES